MVNVTKTLKPECVAKRIYKLGKLELIFIVFENKSNK